MPKTTTTVIALVLWKNAAYPPRIATPVQPIKAITGCGCSTHPAATSPPPSQAIASDCLLVGHPRSHNTA